MKLHILFRSFRRQTMAHGNLLRCVTARKHAFANVKGLESINLTHWVDTEEEKKFFLETFGKMDWYNIEVIKDWENNSPFMMGEFFRTTEADMFEWLWEDIGVYEDTYTLAINTMEERFPKNDKHHPKLVSYNGVLGVKIANNPKHWPWQSSYGIPHFIGSGVIKNHYKAVQGKPLFCPDYKRVIWEVEFTAFLRFHNLIWYCPEIQIDHWIPTTKEVEDEVHKKSRTDGSVKRDRAMMRERQKRGYFWGLNFHLIGDLAKAQEESKRLGDKEYSGIGIYGTREDFA